MIDPKKVKANRDMLRGCNKQAEDYQELLQSIRSKGIIDSISVRDNGDGWYTIVNGFQRLNCALDLNLPDIPAHILDIEESEILEGQIVANSQKIETKPVEYTKGLLRLLALRPAMSMMELAQRLGKSYTWLNDRMHLVKLIPDLQPLVNEGKIPLLSAYALAKCPEEMQAQLKEEAQTSSSQDFVIKVNTLLKNHKQAIREGKKPGEQVFVPTPKLQKVATLQGVFDGTINVFDALSAREQPTNARDGFLLGIKYAMSLDPISVDAAKADYESRQKKMADEAAARKKERDEAKAKKEVESAPKDINGIPIAETAAAA